VAGGFSGVAGAAVGAGGAVELAGTGIGDTPTVVVEGLAGVAGPVATAVVDGLAGAAGPGEPDEQAATDARTGTSTIRHGRRNIFDLLVPAKWMRSAGSRIAILRAAAVLPRGGDPAGCTGTHPTGVGGPEPSYGRP
jgi:hypothetical protein